MPRYHFHTNCVAPIHDEEGTELDSLDAAKREALKLLGAVIWESPTSLWSCDEDWQMRVTDAADLTLFTIAITETEAPALLQSPKSASR